MVTKAFYVQKVIDGNHGGTAAAGGNAGEPQQVLQGTTLCQIRDSSLGPAFKIRVPTDYTVYQTETDDNNDTEVRSDRVINPSSSVQKDPTYDDNPNERRMKLKFLLIGSTNPPDLSFMDVSVIDRVEFHGSICSDFVVFDISRVLPSIRKVKLFFGRKQMPTFQPWVVGSVGDIDQSFVNKSVTSLTIITDKDIVKKITSEDKRAKLETTLEEIIVQIIGKTAKCFPYLRKIVFDIPFSVRLERAAIQLRDELVHLKPTIIETDETGDRLIAKRQDVEEQTCATGGNCMLDTDATTSSSNTSSSLSPTEEFSKNDEEVHVTGDSLPKANVGGIDKGKDASIESNPKLSLAEKKLVAHEKGSQLILPINSAVPIQPFQKEKALNSGILQLASIQFNLVEPSSSSTDSSSLTGLGKLLESMLGVSQLELHKPKVPTESAVVCDSDKLDK